jgi:toxin CcdB
MAQFDVHRNIGLRRAEIPLLVIVQSRRFDALSRRVVAPLVLRLRASGTEERLNPVFEIDGIETVLYPLEIFSIAVDQLGPKVGSLAPEGDRIIAALDLVISRAWG